MHESTTIAELRRHLVELGCPAKAVRHIVRETAEHLEDLQQAALKQGLPQAEILLQTQKQLGDPKKLAEQHVKVLRNASWWGRHPIIGFAILPILSYPFLLTLFALCGGAVALAVVNGGNWQEMANSVHGKNPDLAGVIPDLFAACIAGIYAGVSALALLLCWLTRRAAVGFKWTLIACALTSVAAMYTRIDAFSSGGGHGGAALGIYWFPNELGLACAAIPLLIAARVYFRLRRAAADSEKITNH